MKLPIELRECIREDTAIQIHVGKSKSEVYQVTGRGGEPFYLKISQSGHVAREIEREIKVLNWLSAQGIPVPEPVLHLHQQGQTFFLMTEVPGLSLADAAKELSPNECMRIGANFLRRLHSLDITRCPFDRRLKIALALARENLEAGLVDESDFDSDHRDRSTRILYDEIQATVLAEDLVFAHGDYCFPNIICAGGQVTGLIDLGRAGIADRYQDIGIFLRSFRRNQGEPDVSLFLHEYGLIPTLDLRKAEFFRKLDEFF